MDASPRRDFVIGLFVLAGLAAIAYLSISIGGFSVSRPAGLKLSAAFDETGGLIKGAPVVISGVRVGAISAISLQDDFRAKVDMDLEPTLKLPADSSAAIVTAGVLGDRYVELQPGGDEKMLKSGDRINFTESVVLLERLIGQLVYGRTKEKPGDNSSATAPSKAP